MPEDEPYSWLALAGVAGLYAKAGFERIMNWLERRRNGAHAPRVLTGDRGAAGNNGLRDLIKRFDGMEREGKENRRLVFEKLGELEVKFGRLDERVKVVERPQA